MFGMYSKFADLSIEQKQELPSHLKYYPSTAGKSVTLVLGLSGSGKSTFTNSMAGCLLEAKENEETGSEYLGVKHGQIEHCKTIPGKAFVTFYPQLVPIIKNINLLDCPAFNYEGSKINVAASAIALQMAIHQAASVRGIVLTIKYNSFLAREDTTVQLTLQYLGMFLKNFSQHTNSILFLVTNTPEKIKHSQIISRIIDYVESDLLDENLRETVRPLYDIAKNKPEAILLFNPLAKVSEHPNIMAKLSEFKSIPKEKILLQNTDQLRQELVDLIKKVNQKFTELTKNKDNTKLYEIEKAKLAQEIDFQLVHTIAKAANLDSNVMNQFAELFIGDTIKKENLQYGPVHSLIK